MMHYILGISTRDKLCTVQYTCNVSQSGSTVHFRHQTVLKAEVIRQLVHSVISLQ